MPCSDSLPAEFLLRLEKIVAPPNLAGVVGSFAEVKTTTVRVNTLKTTVSRVLEQLTAAGITCQRRRIRFRRRCWFPGRTAID